jgi:AcrR family transcriptional regulator
MVRKLSPERRAQFLSSALKLFVENGVQNTSTNAIAKDAGSAAGTLFLYFPTKQDLINELVLKIGQEQSDFLKSLLDPTLSVRDTFFTIWDGSLHWFLENMEAYLYIRQVRDSGLIDISIVRESEKFFDYYFEAIQRGLEEGIIKPYPIELIGSYLYQDIVGIMNLIIAQDDPAKINAYCGLGFDIFWDGIKATQV